MFRTDLEFAIGPYAFRCNYIITMVLSLSSARRQHGLSHDTVPYFDAVLDGERLDLQYWVAGAKAVHLILNG
jgi:hypothetical protein